jgi:uncharacterized protein (DUF1501 family)
MKSFPSQNPNRRRFLGQASCSAIGTTSLLSALINLRLTGTLAASDDDGGEDEDYKALVCLFLAGGNDSFNMLAPIDSAIGYPEYTAARQAVALPQASFLPLGDPLPAPDGRTLGLNAEMPELKALFDENKASFVANVGTLVERVVKADLTNGMADLPLGLYSHSDQQLHWQSGLPQDRSPLHGWGGRMADLLRDLNGESRVSMNVSLAGVNLFQSGSATTLLVREIDEVPEIRTWRTFGFRHRRAAIESILDQEYQSAFARSFAASKRDAIAASAEYRAALEAIDPLATTFDSNNPLSSQLKAVAETIAARDELSKKRQTFFVEMGGWDHHGGLENHPAMLGQVSQAVGEFYRAMVELGLENKVTLFTASDFGRTITSNGRGTDHAWGGHQFVVGGAVEGGKIFGRYPSLDLGNDLDTGRGRFIPTTSVDEYVADLALWMGVSPTNLAGLVLPNLSNFHDVVADGPPLGLISGTP